MADQQKKKAPAGDSGEAEVQQQFDEANAKGYFGEVPDGPANSEYSLQSGPDAPDEAEVARKRGAV